MAGDDAATMSRGDDPGGDEGGRVLFMGTPDFAVPSLKAVLASEFEVVGVVTQPDRPRKRGGHSEPSPVRQVAIDEGIPSYTPAKLRGPESEEFLSVISELSPDFIVVVAYGKILPPSILELPRLGCINVHASLLPKYRGAAPINWAIIEGEGVTGVTTMLLDEGMDTGDMLMSVELPLAGDETTGELTERLSSLGNPILIATLRGLMDGTLEPTKQDDSIATYAPMLAKGDGNLDWSKPAERLGCLVRGFSPWPGTFTTYKGKSLKVHRALAVGTGSDLYKDKPPGTVVEVAVDTGSGTGSDDDGGDYIGVKCGSGVLRIMELQPESKRRMSAADFIKGYRIVEGEEFGR